ncbi:hypothetical protein [Streptomyces sp. CBMA123]|uniref:hypothetical protein n=1 Tax=Streptomyces sp. CBMA123 TaxID=1896313 RepID=UPI0016620C64|nr:hypothetical protein [Streptomyces sp. CBMA123]
MRYVPNCPLTSANPRYRSEAPSRQEILDSLLNASGYALALLSAVGMAGGWLIAVSSVQCHGVSGGTRRARIWVNATFGVRNSGNHRSPKPSPSARPSNASRAAEYVIPASSHRPHPAAPARSATS